MTTQFITLTEFRRDIKKIARRSKEKKEKYILQSKDGYCFELRAVSKLTPKKKVYKESFIKAIHEAEEDVKAGRVHSFEEVVKRLGL